MILNYLFYLWGALLPFVTFSPERFNAGLMDRFTAADMVGALLVFSSFGTLALSRERYSFNPSATVWLLFFVVLSTFISGLFILPGLSLVDLFIPLLIFLFLFSLSWVAGCLLKNSKDIVCFATFLGIGATIESIIVYHDVFAAIFGGELWFVDAMEMRVRGTFRTSGQLAQYGLVVGGVIFSLAAWPDIGKRKRTWLLLVAISLFLFSVVTTRRSGMAALLFFFLVWVSLSLLYDKTGWRKAIGVLIPIIFLIVILLLNEGYSEFLTGRIAGGGEILENEDSYIYEPDAFKIFDRYPIFGVGWGQSVLFSSTENEVHNGYLAVLVDSGLPGLFLFLSFVFSLLRQCGRCIKMARGTPYIQVSLCLFSLMLAQMVFWIHNRGLRDRGFFLFITVLAFCTMYFSEKNRKLEGMSSQVRDA